MNRYPEETLFVLGMGPGDLRWIPPATADRALEARTLFGDPRHLDLLPPAPGQDRFPSPPGWGISRSSSRPPRAPWGCW